NRWMTRFALGAKCGLRGARGETARSEARPALASEARRPASPSEAMPMPARQSNSRRVRVSRRVGSSGTVVTSLQVALGFLGSGVGGLLGGRRRISADVFIAL